MPKKAEAKTKKAEMERRLIGPEAEMRDTIEWLLSIPPAERGRMEIAENYTFTLAKPAPASMHGGSAGEETVLATLGMGSVEAAQVLVQRGYRPALLNFAHDYNCGGGFEHSGGSQEEDIFRKTSVFLSLWPHRRSDDGPGVLRRGMWIGDYDEGLERKEPFYPHTECGGIYSPHVRVVRELTGRDRLCDADSFEGLPTFAVLTVAAQNVGFSPPFNRELLIEKIRTVLWMAASHGHDSVVLGAFGCGYFCNPPDVVAGTFQQLLGLGGEFENVFSLVVFAIIGGNTRHFVTRFPLQKPMRLPKAKRTPRRHAGGVSTRCVEAEVEAARDAETREDDEMSSTERATAIEPFARVAVGDYSAESKQ